MEVISYDRLVTEIKEGKVAGIYFTGSYTVNVLYASETDEKNIENFKSGKFANASCVVKYRDDFTETIENYQDNQDNADFTLPYIWLNDPNANSFRASSARGSRDIHDSDSAQAGRRHGRRDELR